MADSRFFEQAICYYKTFFLAMPKLPDTLQLALKAPLGNFDVTWALALVLSGWRLQTSDSGSAVIREARAQKLVKEIDSLPFASLPFKVALTKAEASDTAFDGAVNSLSSAFNDLIERDRSAVIKWLGGRRFTEAGTNFNRRFFRPELDAQARELQEGAPPHLAAPRKEENPTQEEEESPPDASSLATVPRPSRLDRFERADRPRRLGPAVVMEQAEAPIVPDALVEPLALATPQLPPETVARLHLMTDAGWKSNEAERILSGPAGDTGTALHLRQILRTYASLSLPQRARFQALVEQQEEGFEVSRTALLATSVSDIQDVRNVDGLPKYSAVEVFSLYDHLPTPERQRALRWIIDHEASAFATGARIQLPTLYASYRNLPKYERMRFLKLVDEVEDDGKEIAWKTADVSWVSSASPSPTIATAVGMYKAYRRLSRPKRLSLVRAAIENEAEFTLEEMNKTGLGTISPEDLE